MPPWLVGWNSAERTVYLPPFPAVRQVNSDFHGLPERFHHRSSGVKQLAVRYSPFHYTRTIENEFPVPQVRNDDMMKTVMDIGTNMLTTRRESGYDSETLSQLVADTVIVDADAQHNGGACELSDRQLKTVALSDARALRRSRGLGTY